jgi:hypothetical protein
MTNDVAEVREPRSGEIRPSDMQDFLQVIVRGQPYPRITERRCHTCTHPLRFWIEAQFIGKTPVPTIIAHIPDDPDHATPSEQSIRGHFKEHHVDRGQEALVDRYIKAAEDMGMPLEEYFDTLSAEASTARLVVDKFTQRVINDPMFLPDYKDGLAAAKLLKEIEQTTASKDEEAFDRQDMLVVLSMFIAHTRTVFAHYMPREMESAMTDLGRLLKNDPILGDLIEKTQEAARTDNLLNAPDEEEDVQEAEIVEEDDEAQEVDLGILPAPGPFTAEDLNAPDEE